MTAFKFACQESHLHHKAPDSSSKWGVLTHCLGTTVGTMGNDFPWLASAASILMHRSAWLTILTERHNDTREQMNKCHYNGHTVNPLL